MNKSVMVVCDPNGEPFLDTAAMLYEKDHMDIAMGYVAATERFCSIMMKMMGKPDLNAYQMALGWENMEKMGYTVRIAEITINSIGPAISSKEVASTVIKSLNLEQLKQAIEKTAELAKAAGVTIKTAEQKPNSPQRFTVKPEDVGL